MLWALSILALSVAGFGIWLWQRRASTVVNASAYFEDTDADFPDTEAATPYTPPSRAWKSVDVLTHAHKREAVHNGRIILDWLRNLQFSNKSLQEIIDTGNPEEQAQLTGVVAQAVNYFNEFWARLRAKDTQTLAGNEQVQEALKAASVLKHTILLLAELTNAVTLDQTMKISTDVSQQPEHWGQLKDRTVDRLMDTLKGGLEEIVSAMDQQLEADQERQQDEMVTLESSDNLHTHGRKRRRRRRKSSSAGQVDAKQAARKLAADDIAKGEGIGRHLAATRQIPLTAPSPSHAPIIAAPVVNQTAINVDMAVIREIGRTLASQAKQASQVQTDGKPPEIALKAVTADERPRPNDSELSAQELLRQQREQQKQARFKPQQHQPRQG